MEEGLEAAKTEDAAAEQPAAPLGEATTRSSWTSPSWLRLAYSFEFLLALIAVYQLWSEIGGQGHLDMMTWYTKLLCGLAMAWCTVRFTAGLVEEERAWNSRSRRWLAGLAATGLVMGGITLYYHLHEDSDQPDGDDATETSVRVALPSIGFFLPSERTNG